MRVWRKPKEGVISNNSGTTGIELKYQERHQNKNKEGIYGTTQNNAVQPGTARHREEIYKEMVWGDGENIRDFRPSTTINWT